MSQHLREREREKSEERERMGEGGFEALLVHAGGDGVGPSVLMSAPGGVAQYLVNVPSGLSRLGLEHKVRPSSHLSCILLTSLHPYSSAGLGGLMLRLAQDGHGQCQLLGPCGSTAFVHSMRHIFRWIHPKVIVSECQCDSLPVFEDNYVYILPLLFPSEQSLCQICLLSRECTKPVGPLNSDDCSSGDSSSSDEDVSSDSSSSDGLYGVSNEAAMKESSANVGVSNCKSTLINGGLFSRTREFLSSALFTQNEKTSANWAAQRLKRKRNDGVQYSSETTKVQGDNLDNKVIKSPCKAKDRNGLSYGRLNDFDSCLQDGVEGCVQDKTWTVHNNSNASLPVLPDGWNPVYSRSALGNLGVPDMASDFYSESGSKFDNSPPHPSSGKLFGYFFYLKQLQSGVLMIDIGDMRSFNDLQRGWMKCNAATLCNLHSVSAVIHLSPLSVLKTEEYSLWMKGFGEDVSHVVLHREVEEFAFISSLSILAKLNLINTEIFPFPSAFTKQTNNPFDKRVCGEGDVLNGCFLMRIAFSKESGRIKLSVDTSMHLDNSVETEDIKKYALQDPVNSIAGQLLTEEKRDENDSKSSNFVVTFLGTGSAEPNRYRGSSGILLQVMDEEASILLDAGEGVDGQLKRTFTPSGATSVINSLQCVWLSHKHADHVLGVTSIIFARSVTCPPLLVVGSTAISKWLSEMKCACRTAGLTVPPFVFIHCKEFTWPLKEALKDNDSQSELGQVLHNAVDKLHLKSICTVSVDHCFEAFGLVLKATEGWSLVYSGDTRPCARLVEAGLGCTLLIHEATFEDKLETHARLKRHSTVGEALLVAQRMDAASVILTHFSNRSPKVVEIDSSKHNCAFLAFDGMKVHRQQIKYLPVYLPLITNTINASEQAFENRVSSNNIMLCTEGSDLQTGKADHGSTCSEKCIEEKAQGKVFDICLQQDVKKPYPKHIRWDSDCEEVEP